jgi:hypothetical protein
MVNLYGEDNVRQSQVATGDMCTFEVSPPYEPITPYKMLGWFSIKKLKSVVIQCRWVLLTEHVSHGKWTMDDTEINGTDYYEADSDQVVDENGRLVPSGHLLALLKEWSLDSQYV